MTATPELVERVDRLERMLADLVGALLREGTERDGNWGYPSRSAVLLAIQAQMPRPAPQEPPQCEHGLSVRHYCGRCAERSTDPRRPMSEMW